MDQREWDYGARMSRERRAAESRSSRSSDSPDLGDPEPKWSSLTDTGSLQPSAEALDWQRRADAWAQQAETPDQHQSVEPANRWSDVASTNGRPTFPPDGVSWRTETAEWRATGARWRQTTEWRSTTGSHGWRSTTEAWQTGGNDSYPPSAETPASQPALSSTAWSDDSGTDTRPSWQEFADPSSDTSTTSSRGETTTPSWQQSAQQQSWQQPSPRTPAESSPSWQQLVEPTPQQPSWNSRPSWQRDAIEGSATWTDLTDQRSSTDSGASWLRPDDDGRHLVREDDRAAWRRGASDESPQVGRRRAPEPGSAPSGGTGWSSSRSDSDNWENTDNWARHTDTGSIQLYGDTPAPPSAPSTWGTGTGFGSRNVNRRDESHTQSPSTSYGDSQGYQIPPATPYGPPPRPPRRDDTSTGRALPNAYEEPTRPSFTPEEGPAAGGRRQRGRRYADEEPGYPTRGAAAAPAEPRAPRRRSEPDETATFSAVPMPAPPPAQRSAPPSAQRSAMPADPRSAPPSAQRSAMPADPRSAPPSAQRSAMPAAPRSAMPAAPRSAMPAAPRSAMPAAPGSAPASAPRSGPAGGAPTGRAKYNGGGNDWREQTGSWEAEPDTSSWVRDPDTGQWSRSEDDPRILAWRREAARREAMGEGPRALPAAPAPSEPEARQPEARQPEARPEPTTGGWRNTPPPPLPPGPTPRSATPYSETDYGTTPAGYSPGSTGRDNGYGPAGSVPSSDNGYGSSAANGYGSGAANGYGPAGNEYGSGAANGYGPGPTSSVPGGRNGYGAGPAAPLAGYGSTPTSPARDDGYGAGSADGYGRDGGAAGYGAAPTSSAPGRGYQDEPPRGYGTAPGRDDDRYDAPRGYSAAPTSSMPGRGRDDGPRGYGVTPTSSMPGRGRDDDPRGYGVTPTSSMPGRGRDDDPRGFGVAPTSSMPGRGRDDDPRSYGAAPTSSAPGRELALSRGYQDNEPPRSYQDDEPRGYGAAPGRDDDRYDPPRGGSYGSTPTGRGNAAPTGRGYDEATGRGYDEPTGRGYDEPTGRGYDEPTGRGYGSSAGRGYQDEPGNAPRSGTAYGSATSTPYGGRPALPSAPRSAPGYGDDATTVYPAAPASGVPASGVPGGPIGYSASAPVSAPRNGYSGAASVPPVSADPYGESPRSGRRRGAGDEPLSPEAWQLGGPARSEAAPWSLDEPDDGQLTDTATWALEERRERARGSAVYREGGGGDWRRDLADKSDLAEGESRRFGTSDYMPFRAGGSAAVSGQSNLSTTSTSLISPVARDVSAMPQRGGASWNGPSGAYERRPVTNGYPTGRKSDVLDPDDEEGEQESGGPLAAVGYTVIWYGVPVVLFVAYMLVVGAGAQGHALSTLAKAAPQFLISLVLSVVVAIGLRFVSHSWKAISVGLAAAVVGGGLATVLTSAITGNSLS
ncbi:hypothetical protein JIG36_15280 [Actinoplanes sp. LDG1-06]|uniref:Uncharacterized protein n=1 Tax=Paractinoplanes ovalisporus TaxID=2810368 RepID=A0ABS2AAR7_9ACTN|nr:hypothetical protein [Actinoplanes ovalisporus]MBM2616920.1 hypothetical protein [Actinoplanes ovalisporus]